MNDFLPLPQLQVKGLQDSARLRRQPWRDVLAGVGDVLPQHVPRHGRDLLVGRLPEALRQGQREIGSQTGCATAERVTY